MSEPANNAAAGQWYAAGLVEHDKFVWKWREAKGHAFDAGFYFLRARSEIRHGDWLLFLQTRERKMKERTIRFYMELAQAALAWAKVESPGLPDAKLVLKAKEIMMMSPKPLVALLRDLRLMRPFGEYDAVKYAQRRLGAGQQQLELDFSRVVAAFDALDHIGEPNFTLTLPEGTTEERAWEELETRLEHALEQVRARKAITINMERTET